MWCNGSILDLENKLILVVMDYTQARGNIVEIQCMSKFFEYGIECSIPYGNGARYDFIADINGQLIRIQCKSSSMIDNVSFHFSTVSQTTNSQKTTRHRYTKNEIDYFATYYNEKVYLVPVEECSTSKTLRFAPPSNGQKNYNRAEDYEIDIVLEKIFNLNNLQKEKQEKIVQKFYCIKCNKNEVGNDKQMCVECFHITQRTVERPCREELKAMIKTMPFVQIGRKYGVSDKAIVKWCIAENLPSKKSEIKNYSDKEWELI